MIMQILHCPHCQGTDIIRHGTTRQGSNAIAVKKPHAKGARFCWSTRTPVTPPGSNKQIIGMAMNASGIRDTARVLHVSPTTVLKELK